MLIDGAKGESEVGKVLYDSAVGVQKQSMLWRVGFGLGSWRQDMYS